MDELKERISTENIPILLLGNKCDLAVTISDD
jgi:hypothetical protein